MKPSIPPTLKQLKALGYPDEKFIALNALKNRSLNINSDVVNGNNFELQCQYVVVEYAKTVKAVSNMLEVVQNAEEVESVVDKMYVLKSVAKKTQEKIKQKEMLKIKQMEEEDDQEKVLLFNQKDKPEQQGQDEVKVKGSHKIIESTSNLGSKIIASYRRPSRPPPSIPSSKTSTTTNNSVMHNNIMIIEDKKREVKIKIKVSNSNKSNCSIKNNNGNEKILLSQKKKSITCTSDKSMTITNLEDEIDSVFGQFEGLKRLTMIIGIENAVPIIERAAIIQNAIVNNNDVEIVKKDIGSLKSSINVLQALVNKYTG